MRHGLLHFIISILIVFVFVLLIDILVGIVVDKIIPRIAVSESIGKTYYSLNEVEAPIVIIGSSRASHHYVSDMIEDSLSMPTYNLGVDGCFFTYNLCVINSILDRYSPNLIIWENSSRSLEIRRQDPLTALYPYYKKNPWVTQAISQEEDKKKQVMLYSNLYRYNSLLPKIVLQYCSTMSSHRDNDTLKGFEPLEPRKLQDSLDYMTFDNSIQTLSDEKIKQLEKMLDRIKNNNINFVMVDSPEFIAHCDDSESKKRIMTILNERGYTYIDNAYIKQFSDSPNLFNDDVHLNKVGAEIYTKIFINQLEELSIVKKILP